MTTHILQCVWPITDPTVDLMDLIAEAAEQLEDLSDQAHANITGPPVWFRQSAANVAGWTGYAPGDVLIARMPAEDYGNLRQHRLADPEPDWVVVERLIAGTPPRRVRPIERTAAMAVMSERGAEPDAVASRFNVSRDAVNQAIHRHRRRQPALAAA